MIKRKHFALKPMHVDLQAILQMELLGHNFDTFLNAETEVPNVVYKRNAGGYGLLEPDET
ncbi:MAG: sigma 54 modulation/S30EA ribosomal C-terminal domain-containing protein [Acutalibacteraceae bacterium]